MVRLYKVSKAVEKKAKEYIKKGYKIAQTTDSAFLLRHPRGRKDLKRVGVVLGTGGGKYASTTVFAYKEVKIKKNKR
ncbi:hypothetical protein DRN85_10580 [Methanosarcinales archaeon]|nr:MAG: hypothetical protein DRN85_10580 [Methanosarcinales archaeon]